MVDLLACLAESCSRGDLAADRLNSARRRVVLLRIEEVMETCHVADKRLRDNAGRVVFSDLDLLLSACCRESHAVAEMILCDILHHRKKIIDIDVCCTHCGHISHKAV